MDSFTVDPWPAWDSDMRTSFSCSRQFLHFVLTKSRTRRAAQWREAAHRDNFTLHWTLVWIGVLKLVFMTWLHMAEQTTFHSFGKCKRALPHRLLLSLLFIRTHQTLDSTARVQTQSPGLLSYFLWPPFKEFVSRRSGGRQQQGSVPCKSVKPVPGCSLN